MLRLGTGGRNSLILRFAVLALGFIAPRRSFARVGNVCIGSLCVVHTAYLSMYTSRMHPLSNLPTSGTCFSTAPVGPVGEPPPLRGSPGPTLVTSSEKSFSYPLMIPRRGMHPTSGGQREKISEACVLRSTTRPLPQPLPAPKSPHPFRPHRPPSQKKTSAQIVQQLQLSSAPWPVILHPALSIPPPEASGVPPTSGIKDTPHGTCQKQEVQSAPRHLSRGKRCTWCAWRSGDLIFGLVGDLGGLRVARRAVRD